MSKRQFQLGWTWNDGSEANIFLFSPQSLGFVWHSNLGLDILKARRTTYDSLILAIYRLEEKKFSSLVFALLPSLLHGFGKLYSFKMGPRRTWNASRPRQCVRSRVHVFLLLPDCSATRAKAINLVEETHYPNSAGKFQYSLVEQFNSTFIFSVAIRCLNNLLLSSSTLWWLRLSKVLVVDGCDTEHFHVCAVCRFL